MARKGAHPDDPRALIAEAYRIEGLGPEDARAIFFDWALGLPIPESYAGRPLTSCFAPRHDLVAA